MGACRANDCPTLSGVFPRGTASGGLLRDPGQLYFATNYLTHPQWLDVGIPSFLLLSAELQRVFLINSKRNTFSSRAESTLRNKIPRSSVI